ncbi:MAG: acyl--CoA ligase [Deltaproteobacteria bacterium]|nr:acyl--CoA ligase [Deltaproteobacteria bacterium]MBW2394266.1 acyl--CoA ligase [Deltaproteobacteria bacterium]
MDPALENAWKQLTAPGAPFAWSVQDIRGVPTRTYDTAPPTMLAIWEASAAHDDADYLIFGEERTSYADAHQRVASLAAYLSSRGVGKGDRVAVAMRNYPEWVLSYWAIVSLGAAVVGMNAWWTGPEMEYGLADSAPKVLIADDQRLATLAPHLEGLRKKAPLELLVVRSEEKAANGAVSWEEAMATPTGGLPFHDLDPEDDVCVFYTSGTTGFPKGAAMTHRGAVSNLLNLAFWATAMGLARPPAAAAAPRADAPKHQATTLLAVPLFHVTGCNCCLHPVTATGGRIILLYKWNAGEALETIEREKVDTFTGVPMMSRELVEHPEFASRDTSSLTGLGGGGAAVQPDLVEKIEAKLERGRAATGYGLTETCGVISVNSGDFFVDKPDTVGPALPVVEAKIVDEEGKPLPSGQVGELLVRGPNNVRGYLNKPEATEEAFPEGWFRTGDLATLDEDGFISIRDRAKDMVLRGGENIYCAEVEAAIFDHPAVKECAVFAVPDDRFGEVPGVAVVCKPGASVSEDELRAHAGARIAAFKVPARFWFPTEDLPRNANGKFVKRQLKEELLGS